MIHTLSELIQQATIDSNGSQCDFFSAMASCELQNVFGSNPVTFNLFVYYKTLLCL